MPDLTTPDKQLKAGDTVQLKSGGPTMTIDIIEDFFFMSNARARCIWFAQDQVKEEFFELHILKKV